jgi:hypothetical protein
MDVFGCNLSQLICVASRIHKDLCIERGAGFGCPLFFACVARIRRLLGRLPCSPIFSRTQVSLDFGFASMFCPVCRSTVPKNVFYVDPSAAFDQKLHHFVVAAARSLM